MKTTFIDTHCHLNFKRFNKTRGEVITQARKNGVIACIIPGTDIFSSKKAVEIAQNEAGIYAAVGIHPHHTFEAKQQGESRIIEDVQELDVLIGDSRIVAVGEVGLDRHAYEDTKYHDYQISDVFMRAQTEYLVAQIRLAKKYNKSLIIHNRETKKELLAILNQEWDEKMRFRTVFHCCEPDEDLLSYAQEHSIYVGVDGDVTYGGEKASFIKRVPIELLVLETDSPFILPEPLRTQKLYPNTPANIPLIAACVAELKGISVGEVGERTTENAKRLFGLASRDIQSPKAAF